MRVVSWSPVLLLVTKETLGFTASPKGSIVDARHAATLRKNTYLLSSVDEPQKEVEAVPTELVFQSQEEKDAAVGNLVADDEWAGLSMELTEVVRKAVVEDLKKNARDFLGKEEYKLGDVSKEIDSRVKEEIARMRGKEEYEIGDFIVAIDETSKRLVEEQTGKPYETGDLSREIDARVKESVAKFCGKEEYEFGDLSTEMGQRIKSRVEEFTGKPDYEFGDVTRTINERRKAWVMNFLGEEAASNYQFGDITKKWLGQVSGKGDGYQFGDLTKKIAGNIFGGKK